MELDDFLQRTIAEMNASIEDYDPSEPYPKEFERYTKDVDSLPEFAKMLEMAREKFVSSEIGLASEDERERVVLEMARWGMRLKPFLLIKAATEVLSKPDVHYDDSAIEETRKTFDEANQIDKLEIEHAKELMLTNDALGIFLRGFVLIEDQLDACFESFLAKPVDLYREFDLYFSGKLKLGKALGFISEEECSFFAQLNSTRNKLAHKRQPGKPRFMFTAERERELWDRFVTVPTLKGAWPEYNDANFLLFLRIMLIRGYILFYNRSERVSRLPTLSGHDLQYTLHRYIGTAHTMFTVHQFRKIMDRLNAPRSDEEVAASVVDTD